MSLHQKLNDWIEQEGHITLQQLEDYCHQNQYKLSNAERRLRPSESPCVQGFDKFGKPGKLGNPKAVIEYRWMCTKKEKQRPTWDELLEKIEEQKQEQYNAKSKS
jgi:hypothetical protein